MGAPGFDTSRSLTLNNISTASPPAYLWRIVTILTMPPVRTMSTAKPVKTERTHEENQERSVVTVRTSDFLTADTEQSIHCRFEAKRPQSGSSYRVCPESL